LKPESPLYKWVEVFKKIESLTGKSFFWDDKMQQSISDAGFTNVSGRRIKVPIGTWPKDKILKQWGAWDRHFLLQGLEGFSIRGLTEMLGVSWSAYRMVREFANDGGISGNTRMLSCSWPTCEKS